MEYSFLMIKPDAYNKGVNSAVRNDILLMCEQSGLSVIDEWTKRLSANEVIRIYPNISELSLLDDFLSLMTSNYATLILLSGFDAVNKAKIIRGNNQGNDPNKIIGIRGKYCQAENLSDDDWLKLNANCHPNQRELAASVIENVIHAPDSDEEISVAVEIFMVTAD